MDTGLDSLKTASKKVVYKAGEFLENKTADAGTKSNDDNIEKPDENPRNVEEIIVPLEKKDEILNKLRKVGKKWEKMGKMEHYKISKLLNNSTISKFMTKNGS